MRPSFLYIHLVTKIIATLSLVLSNFFISAVAQFPFAGNQSRMGLAATYAMSTTCDGIPLEIHKITGCLWDHPDVITPPAQHPGFSWPGVAT